MTVCLCMIVKNEARVIARCLASVKPFVDRWVIVDTGSTDGTQDIVRETLADVPGVLSERPWVDFGQNRSEALRYATATGADYALVIDADEVLVAEPDFAWPELTADGYHVLTRMGSTEYDRMQLLRLDCDWFYVGVLHEYPHYEGRDVGSPVQRILGLKNHPIQDGARCQDPAKYAKDAAVLKAALETEPGNVRYVYYLAQSLRDAGEIDEAIAWYDKRAAMGGWPEESWSALFMAAELRDQAKRPWPETLAAALRAYEARPSRAESSWLLAKLHRLRGERAQAHVWARVAAETPRTTDSLRVMTSIYDWQALDEYAIAANNMGKHDLAVELNNKLLEGGALPPHEQQRVLANRALSTGATGKTRRTYVKPGSASSTRPDMVRAHAVGDRIYALTSLSPSEASVPHQQTCIASWRAAGLDVVVFASHAEIEILRSSYEGVTFVAVPNTTEAIFGKPYVPISAMLQWAATEDVAALLINADIELRLTPREMGRIRWLSDGGLCYFVRYNYDGAVGSHMAWREQWGIDAFLVHGREGGTLADTFLSMGQPAWDYWLPSAYMAKKLPVFSVEFPAALHRMHEQRWSWKSWSLCANELARLRAESYGIRSDVAPMTNVEAQALRDSIHRARIEIPPEPEAIHAWIARTFADDKPKTFLEIGAHAGHDTVKLAQVPRVTVHAFEPDPRNTIPEAPNVVQNRKAVAAEDGPCAFTLSAVGWGQEWTYSSSIRTPKHHTEKYPSVSFGDTITVDGVRLDSYCKEIDAVDFIWADVQGAEGDVIRGGKETLARTRYLYTEFSNEELYEGQIGLTEILRLLPDFSIVEIWEGDVLLKNRTLSPGVSP